MLQIVPSNPATVGETAYQQIRTDILSGRLLPGHKLKLDQLRTDYQTSINTLRETLSRLVSEDLVVSEAARGFEVAPISRANLLEVAELRLLLESYAMEQSFAKGDLDWEARVVASHYKLSELQKRGDGIDFEATRLQKRCDWEFHSALISACGSRSLIANHTAVFERYMRYLMIALVFRGSVAATEHDQLLAYALKRDCKAAVDLLRDHVNGCVAFTLENWTWA